MPLNHTVWRPATCECEIVIEWDTAVPPEERTHSLFQILVLGPEHAGLSGQALEDTIEAECNTVSTTVSLAHAMIPEITGDAYDWAFDADRVLEVAFTNIALTPPQRRLVQDACDLQFGPGKVVVL